MALQPTIFVVDDDAGVRDAFRAVLESDGYFNISTYESSRRFIEEAALQNGDCVLLDYYMPDLDGLVVQEKLNRLGLRVSVIVITGRAEYSIAVKALRAGAVDFIEKPVSTAALLSSVRSSLAVAEEPELGLTKAEHILRRLKLLTPREREVFDRIVQGWPSKLIAYGLSISTLAVEMHRATVMGKMQALNLAALIRMALAVGTIGKSL